MCIRDREVPSPQTHMPLRWKIVTWPTSDETTVVTYTVEFSQTKRCFFSFLKQNIQRQMIHQHHYRLHNTIHILLKTRSLFYSSCSFCLFCLRSTNAIERRHWLLASVSIASVLSEHKLFVYMRHIWSAVVWGASSSRKKGIKRLEHQKIYSVFCI